MPSFAVLRRRARIALPDPRRSRSTRRAMGESFPGAPSPTKAPEDRLDSWKEIAAYLNRDVTTVQRWEKREGMPVHRHQHDRMGSVYASRAELDAWTRSRNLSPVAPAPSRHSATSSQTRRTFVLLAAAAAALAIGASL